MTVAAAIPWKTIIDALPHVIDGAKVVLKMTSKPKPTVDPTEDLRTQLASLTERVDGIEAAQSEQAKVVAQIAEQLQAIAIRSARGYWLAFAALCFSVLSLAVSVLKG